MPAHTTQLNANLIKTAQGFNIQDSTEYPTGSNNHKREQWKFFLIVVDDPRGNRFLLSTHDFLTDIFNSIDSPATVATAPLTIPKSDSGVGRYNVTVYGFPEFDSGGTIEDNYGDGDVFGVLNSDSTISIYQVQTDVTPSTDTDLTDTTKYQGLSSVTNLPSRYKSVETAFFVMEEWIKCFREKLEAARCKIIADPMNQKKLCKDKDVITIAELLPIKRSVLEIEAGNVSLTTAEEKKITNLANSLCCCRINPAEDAASGSTSDTVTTPVDAGTPSGNEGIGFWIIEDDFQVS